MSQRCTYARDSEHGAGVDRAARAAVAAGSLAVVAPYLLIGAALWSSRGEVLMWHAVPWAWTRPVVEAGLPGLVVIGGCGFLVCAIWWGTSLMATHRGSTRVVQLAAIMGAIGSATMVLVALVGGSRSGSDVLAFTRRGAFTMAFGLAGLVLVLSNLRLAQRQTGSMLRH